MTEPNTLVAVFKDHEEADAAVRKLAGGGIDMKHLSVVGKGYHTDEKVVGFYNMGDRVKFWGTRGAFWGGLWGWLFGGVFLMVPVFGHLVVIGYLAAMVVSALEGAVVFRLMDEHECDDVARLVPGDGERPGLCLPRALQRANLEVVRPGRLG